MRSSLQTSTLQIFVSQIFSSLNPFVPGGAKGHIYLNKSASKSWRLFKDVWPFLTTGHERVKIISFTSKQNLSEEKLNSQKLVWFYILEKIFLSTIIYVANFIAVSYQEKKKTYICFFFVLYWFAPFLKFGPLPSENPRCAPALELLIRELQGKKQQWQKLAPYRIIYIHNTLMKLQETQFLTIIKVIKELQIVNT